VGLYKIDF